MIGPRYKEHKRLIWAKEKEEKNKKKKQWVYKNSKLASEWLRSKH